MKKLFILILMIFLTACTTPEVEPPTQDENIPEEVVPEEPIKEEPIEEIEPPVVIEPEEEIEEPIEEPEKEEEPIVEPEEEEPLLVIPEGATVLVSSVSIPDEEIQRLFNIDEWFTVEAFDFNQLMPASHLILIYNEDLLKQIAPIAFGVAQLNPMDVSVREFQNKRFTLIYPGVDEQTEAFINTLTLEDVSEPGDRFITFQPILDLLYPYLTQYGNIGVLTSFAPVGGSAPFLPRGTHQIFNDPSTFFEADLDTRVIIYHRDQDLGYPPSRFGKSLEPGDIEAFVDSDGVRTILIRERFGERLEWFFLSYEVLGLNGKYNSQQVTDLFEYNGSLYRGTRLDYISRPFIPRNVPFQGELTTLLDVVAPIDFCRIQQTNRIPSQLTHPFPHPSTNENYGFPLGSIVPPIGEVNIAIIAIDFPDVPGEEDYLPIYLSQVEILEEWSRFVSGGKMQYNVVFPDRWITAPREARYYSRMGGYHPDLNRPQATVGQSLQDSVQQLVTVTDAYLDWSNIDFVQFVFPIESYKYAVDFQGPVKVNSPRAGEVTFFAWGAVIEHFRPDSPNPRHRTLWDWVAHEILHPQGIVGHAPSNGSAYSIMMDQHADTKALLSWESFLMGHFDEQQIACIDPLSIEEPIHIQLESLDKTGGAPGIKSLMIPVGEFEIVVIEYRTEGPYSILSPEFHGFTAYYIDVDGEYVRCDWCDPLLMEQMIYMRYLRNASENLVCDKSWMFGPVCDFPSIVQYPGYHLDFFGIRLEFHNDGIITIRRLY